MTSPRAPEEAIRARALEEAACVAEQMVGGYLCPYGRDKPGDPTWNHTDADICPVCRENSEGSLLKCHDRAPARIAASIRALITDPDAIAAWNRRAGGEREAWQPIDSAPVDGTKIDVWVNHWKHPRRITDVYWSNIQGWWCIDGHYGPEEPTPLAIIPAPSHWQPLPSAPPRAALAGQTEGERNGG